MGPRSPAVFPQRHSEPLEYASRASSLMRHVEHWKPRSCLCFGPQDNVEREETWLSVWVHEVKGLPRAAAAAAPGVRAELWLDGSGCWRARLRVGRPGPALLGRTGFHFEALPPARRLSLRLRGAGPGTRCWAEWPWRWKN